MAQLSGRFCPMMATCWPEGGHRKGPFDLEGLLKAQVATSWLSDPPWRTSPTGTAGALARISLAWGARHPGTVPVVPECLFVAMTRMPTDARHGGSRWGWLTALPGP